MKASDVMTTAVVTVRPEATVADVARLMLDRHISGVPVVDDRERLVGIVTEGDLMRRAELTAGGEPWWQSLAASPEQKARAYVKGHGTTVRDVMTTDVVTIDENDPLDRIAMIFEGRGIKRAPVLRGGKIVGIVSRANLLQGMVAGQNREAGPDDQAIRTAILTKLREEAGVRDTLLSITVAEGQVDLWGNLGSEAEQHAARLIAQATPGVVGVHDHTRLIPRSTTSWEPE
jgi:CBS domain-containing protein